MPTVHGCFMWCCQVAVSDQTRLTSCMSRLSRPISSGRDTSLLLLTRRTCSSCRRAMKGGMTDSWLRLQHTPPQPFIHTAQHVAYPFITDTCTQMLDETVTNTELMSWLDNCWRI